MASITLSRLLDLAIGTPEVGAVNFNVLYRLLHAMLQKLDLRDFETDIGDLDRDAFAGSKLLAITMESKDNRQASPYHQLEQKVACVLNQLEQLKALPSTKQLSDQVQEKGDNVNPLSYMWQYMQLKNKVENNDEGIQKLMTMVSDMMKQMDILQVSNAHILDKLGDLDLKMLSDKIEGLDNSVTILNDRLDKLPQPEDISSFVTWNFLEDALQGIHLDQAPRTPESFFSYFAQLMKLTPEERRTFIDDSVKTECINQYLPRVDKSFHEMDSEKRHKFVEESIENDTFKSFFPQHGRDLLKMSPKERERFIEDAIKSDSLRMLLPGLNADFELKSTSSRMRLIEDSIKLGKFHKYFPCKYQNVSQMNGAQTRASIGSAIRSGAVEGYLPGTKSLIEKMDAQDSDKLERQAAESGLVETYREFTGNEPLPLSNVERDLEKIIIKECQELMYIENGEKETDLAEYIQADDPKQDGAQQEIETDTHKRAASSSRPGTGQPYSRGSTPGTIFSNVSLGPSPDLLDVLGRLGKLYDHHNRLVRWVKNINGQVQEKAQEDDLGKLEGRVQILEELINKKLEMTDLNKLSEQLSALQIEIEAIKNLVEELNNKEPLVVKSSFPDIDQLVQGRLSDSNAFAELMERVGGLESKLQEFQNSLKTKDSAYSSVALDTLSFLQDSMSEISSDPETADIKRHRRGTKGEKPSEVDEGKGTDDDRFANVEEGSITHGILSMVADTDSDRIKRLGLIVDEQLASVRDTIAGLDEDLKLMAKGVEIALQRVKSAESTDKLKSRPSSSNSVASHPMSPDEMSISAADGDVLRHSQEAIHDLQQQVGRLHKTTGDIIHANNQKQRQIESIIKHNEELNQKKADKDYVLGEFEVKADKRQLESKVNYSLFNKTTDEINQMIKEVESKLVGNEDAMNDIFQHLSEDVDGKMDKLELDPLKGWVDGRLKELNKRIAKTQPGWTDDDAAGLRKQLIQRFHCLSCDKTINRMPKNAIPSLPLQTSLPNIRSSRPYTVFELDQIRQRASKGIMNQNIMNFERALLERQLARIRKSDLRAFLVHYSSELEALGMKRDVSLADEAVDSYARTRACGGLHTMTFPHRRIIRITNLNKTPTVEEEQKPRESYRQCGEEADVQGADGVIYKGRCGHTDHAHGPKGTKVLRKAIAPSTSQPLPRPSSRPVSASNRSQRPSSGRPSSRPISARPNTVQTIQEDGTPATSPRIHTSSDEEKTART